MPEAFQSLVFLCLPVILFIAELLHLRWRASAMRALAERHGFSFRAGDHSLLFPSREPPIPYTFRPRTYPANTLNSTWNVIQGEMKGLQILVLDSNLNLGHRNQRTCTFIAAKAQVSPFADRGPSEQSVLTNGWFALYPTNFFGRPTTLSLKRIEKHLQNLNPSKMDVR